LSAPTPPKDFVGKAEKLLKWGTSAIREMADHGARVNLDEIERHFFSVLTQIDSLHDALDGHAKLIGKAAWRKELDELRSADSLLRYFWLARGSEHHDALLKWGNEAAEFTTEIVDPAKYRAVIQGYRVHDAYLTETEARSRLLLYIFNASSLKDIAMGSLEPPDPELVSNAGIKVIRFARTLFLQAFDVRNVGRVEAPSNHLGVPLAPTAIKCSEVALEFYARKLFELKTLSDS
jgi:hypothetical protein